jgi:hypothetical protein
MANTVLVVHFLERLEGTTELGRHDLDVFGYVAVLPGVRVPWFEDGDIAPVHAPSAFLTKRRERALLPQLTPMTLAVAEREVALRAARKIAVQRGPKKRCEWATGVILCGMSSAVTTGHARSWTSVEAARTFVP